MKTSVLSIKVDGRVKKQTQAAASSFAIPFSTLINAHLTEIASTGQIL